MIFGFSNEEVDRLKATNTVREIRQQPKLWKETWEIINKNRKSIEDFTNIALTEGTKIILTGAGTSDYVGDIAALELSKKLNLQVDAVATTDLVANPDNYIEKNKKTILVSYARSGNSPESVGAYNLFGQGVKDIYQLVITCNEEGSLARTAKDNSKDLVILMPKEANDKSFAMTSSFSCMLLATLLIFDIKNIEKNKGIVDVIAKQGEHILENKWQDVNELVNYGCQRVIYLGSGVLKELGQEMALKNLELTSGKVITVCESILGFRHGPKSMIDDNTLVIVMNSTNSYTNQYDLDLIKEINNDAGTQKLAVISYKKDEKLKDISTKYITINGKEVPEVYTVFNYMLFGQMFGVFSSIKLGISSDNPRPDGTVNRVVKGVTIYDYK